MLYSKRKEDILSRGNITLMSKSKSSWRIRVELPKEGLDRKRRQKAYTFYGTRKDAEKFLTEKLREIDTGILVDNKKLKYSEYLDLWEDKTFKNLEITTIEGYKSKIEKYIRKFIFRKHKAITFTKFL